MTKLFTNMVLFFSFCKTRADRTDKKYFYDLCTHKAVNMLKNNLLNSHYMCCFQNNSSVLHDFEIWVMVLLPNWKINWNNSKEDCKTREKIVNGPTCWPLHLINPKLLVVSLKGYKIGMQYRWHWYVNYCRPLKMHPNKIKLKYNLSENIILQTPKCKHISNT